jgi:hypothetical protein
MSPVLPPGQPAWVPWRRRCSDAISICCAINFDEREAMMNENGYTFSSAYSVRAAEPRQRIGRR